MTGKGETMGERIATAEEWIKGHEERCEDRYRGIQTSIELVQGTLRNLSRGAFLLLLSILGWCLVQLWAGSQARVAALEQRSPPVTVYQSQTPAPAKPAR